MKVYDDDDGRTIANMENLDRRGTLSTWFGILSPSVREDVLGSTGKFSSGDRAESRSGGTSGKSHGGSFDSRNMGSEVQLTREERLALIRYMMKYALEIGLVFIVAAGVMIFLMTKFW